MLARVVRRVAAISPICRVGGLGEEGVSTSYLLSDRFDKPNWMAAPYPSPA